MILFLMCIEMGQNAIEMHNPLTNCRITYKLIKAYVEEQKKYNRLMGEWMR